MTIIGGHQGAINNPHKGEVMAYKSSTYYGSHNMRSRLGENLMASDGNGMTYGELTVHESNYENNLVTPEELTMLIEACASKDIELGSITRPPKVETTLDLAANFFETYLYDTELDRVEVTDRYAAELITQLESSEDIKYTPRHEEVEEYVIHVHEAVVHDIEEVAETELTNV